MEGEWSGEDVKSLPNEPEEKANLEDLNRLRYIRWKSGFRGGLEKASWTVERVIESKYFNIGMTTAVVINTIVLAIYHYKIDPVLKLTLDNINLFFTVLFAVEMMLKMAGLGLVRYFRSHMNLFDCIVVSLSLVEVTFLSGSGLSALRAFRVLRTFRVLRVARVFRYLLYLHQLMRIIEKSIMTLIYMGILIFLFLVVFSLLGMQLFGGHFDFQDGRPRANFDDFDHAFLTSFQLLTMENWFQVLHSGMRTDLGYWAALYFMVFIFFGNFVLLNLFLAIMLNSFVETMKEKEFDRDTGELLEEGLVDISSAKKNRLSHLLKEMNRQHSLDSESASGSMDDFLSAKKMRTLLEDQECMKSWNVFSKTSKVRVFCYNLTNSMQFEWFIVLLILVSSLKLIWETYLINEPADSTKTYVSQSLDILFTVLFTAEFVLKSISKGFIMDKGTYMREGWNQLDFVIVLTSLFDLCLPDFNFPIVKIFRLLRVLRPLRFISHNQSMKIIVSALVESLGALANVTVVVLIVFLIFAILGVSLMAGKMYTCSNPALATESLCLYYGFVWENSPYHYDNVLSAYLALFDITSQENWPDQMYQGIDTVGEGIAMSEDANPIMALFFVIFVMIGNIFFLNLVLAVMFDKFEKAKKTNSSIAVLLLKNEQLRWVELMKYIIRTKRVKVKAEVSSRPRAFVLKAISHWGFEAVVYFCILANMLAMAIAYDQASDAYNEVLDNINLCFTCVFVLEAALKLFGLTVKGYFRDRWNCFDFFVTVAPVLDLVLSRTVLQGRSSSKIMSVGPQLVRVLRILRVSRLLRLIKKLHIIDDLVGMISLSLPAMGNVFMLVVLVFMIYGVLGVFLFNGVTEGLIVDEDNNFEDFGRAVLILVRVSTGEDWNYLLTDLSTHVNPYVSSLFLLTFISLTTFIMFNMCIMVMLQEYDSYHNNPETSSFKIYKENLLAFNTAWNNAIASDDKSKMDPDGLIVFAYEMGNIIEVKQDMDVYAIKKQLIKFGLFPDEAGFVYYHDALFRYFRAKFGVHKNLANRIHKKLMEMEEVFHSKKIRKIVQSDKLAAVAKRITRVNKDMPMFELIFLKSIFTSWLRYSREAPQRPFDTDTPAMDFNFPGVSSPLSLSEGEESKERENLPEITIGGKKPGKAETGTKISRTSTNFSRTKNERVDSEGGSRPSDILK